MVYRVLVKLKHGNTINCICGYAVVEWVGKRLCVIEVKDTDLDVVIVRLEADNTVWYCEVEKVARIAKKVRSVIFIPRTLYDEAEVAEIYKDDPDVDIICSAYIGFWRRENIDKHIRGKLEEGGRNGN